MTRPSVSTPYGCVQRVRGRGLRESEALVEFHRRADVGGRDADLVKSSEHATLPARWRVRRVPRVAPAWRQHARAVGPAFAMLRDEVREEAAVLRARVERRHVNEPPAAGARGTPRGSPCRSLPPSRGNPPRSRGTRPTLHRCRARAAPPSRRWCRDAARRPARTSNGSSRSIHRRRSIELVREQARRLPALVEVRVAAVEELFRNAVERDHQVLACGPRLPTAARRSRAARRCSPGGRDIPPRSAAPAASASDAARP